MIGRLDRLATLKSALLMLRDDRRGVALIEFAFAVPVLVLLFVGSYQLMDAISVYRKVTTTVRALSDLTAQSNTLTATSVSQILDAATQIMAPYPASGATMRITQIKIDNTGKATVDWSKGRNTTGYTSGSLVTLPTALVVNNTYLIYSEISYAYVPNFGSGMIGRIPLSDALYMAPRSSSSIPCPDC